MAGGVKPAVLVTGGGGYIGGLLVEQLAAQRDKLRALVCMDVREIPADRRRDGVAYCVADIRDPAVGQVIREHDIDTVVHLAAVVTPGRQSNRELEYEIDVVGTENILKACVAHGVTKFIFTSSGAAYGYHADNADRIGEDHPLRGNYEFAYSHHKRLVEEMLARYRDEHPELQQLIFRPSAILGERVRNQITDLFEKKFVLGIAGTDAPFVFIWDMDVVQCLLKGVLEDKTGIYNLAGDGTMSPREIADYLHKPYLPLPAWLLQGALAVLKPLGLSQYGPEQVRFLQFRPVLANDRLKAEFGYTPELNSRQVFEHYWRSRQEAGA